MLLEFEKNTKKSGVFENRRQKQTIEWFYSLLDNAILSEFYNNNVIKNKLKLIEENLMIGTTNPASAVEEILEAFFKKGVVENQHEN